MQTVPKPDPVTCHRMLQKPLGLVARGQKCRRWDGALLLLAPSDKLPLEYKCLESLGSWASSQGISGSWNLCVIWAWAIFDPLGLSELIPSLHKQLSWENREVEMKDLGCGCLIAGNSSVPSQPPLLPPLPAPPQASRQSSFIARPEQGGETQDHESCGYIKPWKTTRISACNPSHTEPVCRLPLQSQSQTWPRWENACGRDHPPPKTQSQAFIWAVDCKALHCNLLHSAK